MGLNWVDTSFVASLDHSRLRTKRDGLGRQEVRQTSFRFLDCSSNVQEAQLNLYMTQSTERERERERASLIEMASTLVAMASNPIERERERRKNTFSFLYLEV